MASSLPMSHMILDLLVRRILIIAGCLSVSACAENVPTVPISSSPQGVWRVSEAGVLESTLHLAPDGLFSRVVSDLEARTCVSSSGSWRTNGESLVLTITEVSNSPTSGFENYRFVIQDGRLQLGETEIYKAVGSMVSCADYGFGAWTGEFRATVDGAEMMFEVVDVIVDIYGASFRSKGFTPKGQARAEYFFRLMEVRVL